MRLISFIFFLGLSLQALAIPGDLNADGYVSLPDLVILANSWLTSDGGDLDGDDDTDFADFSILAENWLEGCGASPVVDASNVSAECAAGGEVTITLTAQSASELTYRITSNPSHGVLYDGQTLIIIYPYTLSGNQVRYAGDDTSDTFNWSVSTAANDCGSVGSDTAIATISILHPPTATPQSVNGTSYIWKTITLAATDEGLPTPPGKLKYIISTLPAVGLLYDPKSGAGHINKVPYSLSSWGTDVLYITATAGNSSFGFKATDGGVTPSGGESSAATVSITTAANPLDCLSFDGQGFVTIPDGTYLDVVTGWAIDFWVKTRQPYTTLIDKRGTGAGYEIRLVAGRPYIDIYDTSGKVGTLSGTLRLDYDGWVEIEFVVYNVSGGWQIYLKTLDADEVYSTTYTGSMPTIANAEPVIVGNGFKGQIDKLRYFSGVTDPTDFAFIIQFTERTASSGMFEMVPNVLWMCDEHSGVTITDSKTSKVGTFNSADHVAWNPWIVPFADVSVQQQSYGGSR
jgi:hypothetical protein